MSNAYKSSQGALWIQLEGNNTEPKFLGCHDVEDVAEPKGGVEPVRKFRASGMGWQTVALKQSPPDAVTTTVTTLLAPQRDLIERIKCPVNLFLLTRECGSADVFTNYRRGQILRQVRLTSRTYSGLVRREEDVESTVAVEVSATTPLIDVNEMTIERRPTTLTTAWNDVFTNSVATCAGDCGDAIDEGELVWVATNTTGGGATPDVVYSSNAFLTHAALANDPLAVGENIAAITRVQLGRSRYRLIVAKTAVGGAQGKIAYTDDNAATASWQTVNIGGASAGHGAPRGGALYALNSSTLLLASALGYIYRSEDYGATWTAVESGAIGSASYNQVHAEPSGRVCVAVGGGTDQIAVSTNAGLSWRAVTTAPGSGAALNCVSVIDETHWWVGTANGRLYYTHDGGATWTQRTGWVGSGVGQVRDIAFCQTCGLIGYLAVNSAAPVGTILRTIDGGYTWETITTPTNSGLNILKMASHDLLYAVGDVNGGTAFLAKVRMVG